MTNREQIRKEYTEVMKKIENVYIAFKEGKISKTSVIKVDDIMIDWIIDTRKSMLEEILKGTTDLEVVENAKEQLEKINNG